jgi:hypothetical protein
MPAATYMRTVQIASTPLPGMAHKLVQTVRAQFFHMSALTNKAEIDRCSYGRCPYYRYRFTSGGQSKLSQYCKRRE